MARRELHSSDMAPGQRPPIDLTAQGMLNREPEQIEPVDAPITMDYADALAFGEQPVTIRLDRSTDKYQAKGHSFWVNGKEIWVPVNQTCVIKRKYLEVIARSQPFNVDTEYDDATVANPRNRIVRYQSNRYPFTVVKDPDPRGHEWLQRVMAES